MAPDPRSGRKAALVVWQVDEITQDRERQETGFEKVQQAIAYLDNAPAGFFAADADGGVDYLNATLAQWLGLDLSELATQPLKLDRIMSQDAAALVARAGRGACAARHPPPRHRPRQGRRHEPARAHPAPACP